jgi:hypothetical protein
LEVPGYDGLVPLLWACGEAATHAGVHGGTKLLIAWPGSKREKEQEAEVVQFLSRTHTQQPEDFTPGPTS